MGVKKKPSTILTIKFNICINTTLFQIIFSSTIIKGISYFIKEKKTIVNIKNGHKRKRIGKVLHFSNLFYSSKPHFKQLLKVELLPFFIHDPVKVSNRFSNGSLTLDG